MARPSIYSEELADEICERIADGESLRSICRDDDMPSVGIICRWLAQDTHPGFVEQYTRARQAQAEVIADEVIFIADTEDDTAKAKVRIDARRWYAGKVRPKVYGDRTIQEQSGSVEHKHTLDKDGVKALFDELDRRL